MATRQRLRIRRGNSQRYRRVAVRFCMAVLQVLCIVLFQVLSVLWTWTAQFMRWLRARILCLAKIKQAAASDNRETGEGQFDLQSLAPAKGRPVTFTDVAGIDEAKQEILVRTLLPLKYPAQRAAYRLPTGGGILLWGPPGCGKTLLARAIAGELQTPLFHVRASDLMSQWVGCSEKHVAALFRRVRAEPRAVLFIDEIDALCPSRRKNRSTIMQRVISEFLSQMDGVEQKGARWQTKGYLLLVGATNWPEALDEALLRPGRFDVRAFVGPPGEEARREILVGALRNRPVAPEVVVDDLVTCTEGFTGADLVALVDATARRRFLQSVEQGEEILPLSLADFESVLVAASPSVSSAELRRYERYAQQAFSGPPTAPVPVALKSSEAPIGPDDENSSRMKLTTDNGVDIQSEARIIET